MLPPAAVNRSISTPTWVTDWMAPFSRVMGTPTRTQPVCRREKSKVARPPNPYRMESSEITIAENYKGMDKPPSIKNGI